VASAGGSFRTLTLLRHAGERVAPSLLFFGCRRAAADFYFAAQWPALEAAGALTAGGLITAFSRDQAAKVYVGARIREHGARVWALLQQVRRLRPCLALLAVRPRAGSRAARGRPCGRAPCCGRSAGARVAGAARAGVIARAPRGRACCRVYAARRARCATRS